MAKRVDTLKKEPVKLIQQTPKTKKREAIPRAHDELFQSKIGHRQSKIGVTQLLPRPYLSSFLNWLNQ